MSKINSHLNKMSKTIETHIQVRRVNKVNFHKNKTINEIKAKTRKRNVGKIFIDYEKGFIAEYKIS